MHDHPPAEGEEMTEVEAPTKTETKIRRLLRRAARQHHSKGPTTPIGRETDPNREFVRPYRLSEEVVCSRLDGFHGGDERLRPPTGRRRLNLWD
jgi:hypothetical protein